MCPGPTKLSSAPTQCPPVSVHPLILLIVDAIDVEAVAHIAQKTVPNVHDAKLEDLIVPTWYPGPPPSRNRKLLLHVFVSTAICHWVILKAL